MSLPAIVIDPQYMRELTHDELFALGQAIAPWGLERTADQQIILMPPTGYESGATTFRVASRVFLWIDSTGKGVGFGSDTGFTLPSGALRSPDAAWVSDERHAQLTAEQRRGFAPVCPDFVAEVRSPSDPLPVLKAKMEEWVANGARLAWLIDPQTETAWVYRPGQAPEEIQGFQHTLSGEDVMPGFSLLLASLR